MAKKSKDEIIALSIEKHWFIAKNCKLIVVACNTATTNAIRELEKNMTFLFLLVLNLQ
jgi:glutamate racemase